MSRSIFEEVGGDQAQQGGPTAPGGGEAARAANRARLRLWFLILAAMVVVQILVGGLTRLTDSGLSITDWRPITGWLPPFTDAGWAAAFDQYKTTTEFQTQNAEMTVGEFKTIYWWEFGHRLWGRLIGLAFLIPFAWFIYKKVLEGVWLRRAAIAGGLGLAQGVIGWWMVASGLVGRVDVSQYRLAVHLGLAFVILGVLFWYALSLKHEEWRLLQARRRREDPMPLMSALMAGAVLLQVLMGAFVAGLDGGTVYNQWPGMGDGVYPSGEPFAPFDEAPAAQFTHRILGYLLIIAAAAYVWRARKAASSKTRLWGTILGGTALAQLVIGVITLTQAVPIFWGALHQLGGVALFTVAIHAAHQAAYPAEERIAGA